VPVAPVPVAPVPVVPVPVVPVPVVPVPVAPTPTPLTPLTPLMGPPPLVPTAPIVPVVPVVPGPVAPTPTPFTPPTPLMPTQPITVPVPVGQPPITILNQNTNVNTNNISLVTQVIQQQQTIVQNVLQQTDIVVPNVPPPVVGTVTTPPTPLAATDNFQVIDEASQNAFHTPGSPYSGTVPYVANQYVNLNATNLEITALTPSAFIKSGSGNDTLQAYSGRNVLDAGGGSNVLVGGVGVDTFIASVNTFAIVPETVSDLVKNFHAGDDMIVRGLTPNDFAGFTDGTGAYGPELEINATGANGSTVKVRLAGFTTGDVASGRLTASFSSDPTTKVPYLSIHANS